MKSAFISLLSLMGLVTLQAAAAGGALPATPGFDVIITNGRVIDGSGSPWYQADIGILLDVVSEQSREFLVVQYAPAGLVDQII